MEDFISTFHIDWHLMLAQAVNFAIVAFVVWRYGLKPLVGVLDKRTADATEAAKQAEAIKQSFEEIAKNRADAEADTKRAMQELYAKAEAEAASRRQEILDRVKEEANEVVVRARESFEAEREEALRELRREAARLITLGLTRVVGKIPSGEVDKALLDDVVTELGKRKA